MLKSAAGIVLALCVTSCGQECLTPPCLIPMALDVLVLSASTGKTVSGASVAVSEPVTTTVPCDSNCIIPGYAGTYHLTATAPGYQSMQRTVEVQGANRRCGCASAQTEQVRFVLEPIP